MLKQRLLTLLVLIPLLLLAIWLLPLYWFAALTGILAVWAAWEWTQLIVIKRWLWRCCYVLVTAGLLWGIFYLPIVWVLSVALLFWLWAVVAVVSYAHDRSACGFNNAFARAIMGLVILSSLWLAVIYLREELGGPGWLVFGIGLIAAMDSGAYFVGRLYGRRKLAERLSPNKTWEGFWGGLLLTTIVAVVVALATSMPSYQLIAVIIVAILVGLFAVVGDLFESMLKRQVGVKDTGRLLPGHGGVLDRIDSHLAALPLFALLSLLMFIFGI